MTNTIDAVILLERIGRIIQNDAHNQGLKPTQWEALRYLARANKFSRLPSALTAYLGMTKGTVSQTLNALERKGFIVKHADVMDRRTVKLSLSTDAERLLQHDPSESIADALAELSIADREAINRGLEQLLRSTLKNRGARPFGACRSCRHFQQRVNGGKPHMCGLLKEPLTDDDGDKICVEHEAA